MKKRRTLFGLISVFALLASGTRIRVRALTALVLEAAVGAFALAAVGVRIAGRGTRVRALVIQADVRGQTVAGVQLGAGHALVGGGVAHLIHGATGEAVGVPHADHRGHAVAVHGAGQADVHADAKGGALLA